MAGPACSQPTHYKLGLSHSPPTAEKAISSLHYTLHPELTYLVCDCCQAQLKDGREDLVRKACPALTDELIAAMKRSPMRSYDPSILKEPHIYRFPLPAVHSAYPK